MTLNLIEEEKINIINESQSDADKFVSTQSMFVVKKNRFCVSVRWLILS